METTRQKLLSELAVVEQKSKKVIESYEEKIAFFKATQDAVDPLKNPTLLEEVSKIKGIVEQ